MFFLRTILPSHCPRETPRVEEVDMGVMSPRCIRNALPYQSVFVHNKIAIQWYCKPPSGTASLHIHHWLGTPRATPEKTGWRENVHLAKLVRRRAQGIPFQSGILCVDYTMNQYGICVL